jgi:hypothetical protein
MILSPDIEYTEPWLFGTRGRGDDEKAWIVQPLLHGTVFQHPSPAAPVDSKLHPSETLCGYTLEALSHFSWNTDGRDRKFLYSHYQG